MAVEAISQPMNSQVSIKGASALFGSDPNQGFERAVCSSVKVSNYIKFPSIHVKGICRSAADISALLLRVNTAFRLPTTIIVIENIYTSLTTST